MSKRFAVTFFIVVASILIIFFGYILFLFLFPGSYIFGLKYVALNTHGGENIAVPKGGKEEVLISTLKDSSGNDIGSFSGIKIESHEVPIYIVFTAEDEKSFKIKYKDNYNGLTSSSFKEPSVKFEQNVGTLIITVSEFETFIYESSSSERYLQLYIPISKLSGIKKNSFNLEINSNKSSVDFGFYIDLDVEEAKAKGNIVTAAFDNLTINTIGKVTYNYPVSAKEYNYTTSRTIEVGERNNISASNYTLNSTEGKIIVNDKVDGNLTCETTYGKVLLKECGKDLTVTTKLGDICYNDVDEKEGKIIVHGLVNINSKAGSVTIGEILGNNQYRPQLVEDGENSYYQDVEIKNHILSNSGNIVIDSMKDGHVETRRGSITINSVRDVDIYSKSGKVTVKEVLESAVVETLRSKITIGDDGFTVKDVAVESYFGAVDVKNTTGKVKIKTTSGDVNFVNTEKNGSNDIDINCGGILSAINLYGKVTIEAHKGIKDKDSDGVYGLQFKDVTLGDTKITLYEKVSSAKIYIDKTAFNGESNEKGCSYKVSSINPNSGSSVKSQEFNGIEWVDKDIAGSSYDNPNTGSKYFFHVEINGKADIILRFE